ncbi:radical SAM family heme chaperone HemW [Altericroceibacterium xinjiangense]|uniref:radical SAM family heme chaperone HemW n=1 Tax=Altericroceibacterium xinjiangense TaxID=762261 RepID=UPI000F7DDAC8|nr:radical SAM family heme chaperone HemW [Altericroceibacterium xinjiangense]
MARALYIHWPFCVAKCPYCDFNSHVREQVDFGRWREALLADMRHEADLAGGEPLESIFFGGGTPSLMPPDLVEALLAEAQRLWGFAPDIEITLEANPNSVEAARFDALAKTGVNRLSLGIQALDDEALRFLGRAHSLAEGLTALDIAQRAFDRVSFDLIYARPGQTAAEWQAELERALAFGTGHLSLYQLTIEPGTRFATDVRQAKFIPLEDDPAGEMYELTQELTRAAGISAYEISNHARPGQESRHNLTYWRYRDYCGIGPGAHGRRRGAATVRHKKPENWLEAVAQGGNGIREERTLGQAEQASEALLMGLRLAEGVDLAEVSRRFDFARDDLIDAGRLGLYQSLGLAWSDTDRIGITPKGFPLLDALLGELVPEALVSA